MKNLWTLPFTTLSLFHTLLAAEVRETRVAPDISILTEISAASPFVGQQVGLLYRLRVLESPAAVDIDPQQFTGFWFESVAVNEMGRRRSADGRFEDYVLRRVVLFPLYAGEVRVPPLRVKIKRTTSTIGPAEWDLVGSSAAVLLRVREATAGPRAGQSGPLVGVVSGRLFEESRAGAPAVFLELKGTANLALFDPATWITPPGGGRVTARQVDYDRTVQGDLDRPESLPTVVMRCRWELRGDQTVVLPDLEFPVFNPASEKLGSVRIPFPVDGALKGVRTAGGGGRTKRPGASDSAIGVGVVVTGAVALVLSCVALFRRQRRTRPTALLAVSALREVIADEKRLVSAPRTYFEHAQRAVKGCARELAGDRAVQDGATDCGAAIERWRFSPVPPAAQDRGEVTRLLHALLTECERAASTKPGGPSRAASKEERHMLH
jgi:hypothetical protein